MLKSAWRTFGPDAPVAVLGAQIMQESAWKLQAKSWAGAEGLAQFMPGTAADMAARFPNECAPANPYSAQWAFRCRDRYLQILNRASRNERTTDCDEWAFGLRRYNGGGTHLIRDQRLAEANGADPDRWQEVAPFNASRKPSAWKENTEYPVKIFRRTLEYDSWGRSLLCLCGGERNGS
jgi:membrane-bound lytic murein transglycosylase MltF